MKTVIDLFKNIALPHIMELIKLESELLFFHSRNVSELSSSIARLMGLPNAEYLRIAGILHDVGKLAVPDEILKKPGRLDPRESELMSMHAVRGQETINAFSYALINSIGGDAHFPNASDSRSFFEDMALIVRRHHELPDGSGYPDAITRSQMRIEEKILAVSDKICAFMEERPYRTITYPKEVAIEKGLFSYDWGFTLSEIQAIQTAVYKFQTAETAKRNC